MNYAKVQAEIIQEILSSFINDSCKGVLYDDMVGTRYVGIVPSPYYAYVIPQYLLCIDKSRMNASKMVSAMYARDAYTMSLNATSHFIFNDKKELIVEYVSENGKSVYVKDKFLKKFGKSSDLILKGESPKSVIHIYEKKTGLLLGYVMPFDVKTINEKE